MEKKPYRILYQGGSAEIVEKKSRFLADTCPVKDEEEAMAFIEQIRRRYWDARHHCFAYVAGEDDRAARCSDDGEPQKTAGVPIMDVLKGEGVHGACVVVTRYFGGTLLGTGGLVRAYSAAAKEGLMASRVVERREGALVRVTADYVWDGKLRHEAAKAGAVMTDAAYTDRVSFLWLVPADRAAAFRELVCELTGGSAGISEGEPVRYWTDEEGTHLF